MELTQKQIELLRERLPDEAVSQHPTKSYLSSIKAIYVVERLNKVFGIGKWRLISEIVNDKSDMIVVKSKLSIPDYNIELESYGGNDNGGFDSKNFDLGDAYKGATTDALTKICSYLEIGIDVFKGIQIGKSKEVYKKPIQNKSTTSNEQKFVNSLKDICEICKNPISEKVKTFSQAKFQRSLCMDCQQNIK